MTDIQLIPLNKLYIAECNVRKTAADDELGDMIASLEAHGLLQCLVVQPGKRGRFAIIAGGRRYRGLSALAEAGKLEATHQVACQIIAADADATELSLAENIIRAPMHPADQFEAFVAVIDQGKTTADVAARFNVTEQLVTQRLKLGRLSPEILKAYREDVIDLAQAQAFALSDDHAEQERIFAELGDHLSTYSIREALTQNEVPPTDKRVRCIGIEAYVAAGGTVRRDLFQKADSCYLQDSALLDRLVMQRLTATLDAVRGEGWLWVELMPDAGYSELSKFERVYAKRKSISKDVRTELKRLSNEYDELVESLNDDDVHEANNETQAQLDALQKQIDELTPPEVWSNKAYTTCGAIVRLGHDGSIEVERGLMHPKQARKAKAKAKAADTAAAGVPDMTGFSAKLVEDLTEEKTAAIRCELAERPSIALATIVHALAVKLLYQGDSDHSCLDIRANRARLAVECKATLTFEAKREAWGDRLPGEVSDLFAWCLEQHRDVLDDLLAFLVACLVDGVQHKHVRGSDPSLRHADALATALNLEMTDWYMPTAENFFGKISRKTILSVLDEAKGVPQGPGLEQLNKADLASRATQIVQGTGWLPSPLRTARNDNAPAAADLPTAAE